jgi:hypothetical protein
MFDPIKHQVELQHHKTAPIKHQVELQHHKTAPIKHQVELQHHNPDRQNCTNQT